MDEMKLNDSDMAELRSAFFSQADEILDNLPACIMAVEENPDEESWKALKRSFHTLKGDSKAMGFDSLSAFAHKVEDLIAVLKSGEVEKASIDLLLECADAFGTFVDLTAEGGEPDIAEIVSKIDSRIRAGAGGAVRGGAQRGRKNSERAGKFLRIESERVDRIINLVGELVIGRSMLTQISAEIADRQRESVAARLFNLSSSFERTLSELQQSVMKVRMLPVELIFRPFPRMVRDLSAEKGKTVRLRVRGEDTELDKGIVDVLGEPIMHLLRNAIDHGIESPGERKAAGKPEEGVLALTAFYQGNQIVIEVEDDGRGIDIQRVKESAVRRGVISADEARKMNAKEAMDLIFTSGLSTSERITEVSGRGVGMDIVKEVIESLRGIIEIGSEPGRGTKFTLRLPLTLAIIKSILFTYNGEPYAIPLSSITEIVRALPDNFDTIQGTPVIRHREGVVPIISIDGRCLQHLKSFVIFIGIGNMRAGLMAGSIIGEEELVIKALDDRAAGGIAAGASILGNGSVVLILDPLFLIKRAAYQKGSLGGVRRPHGISAS
jgi:two-component system chemotaxis sensor kinase CheA